MKPSEANKKISHKHNLSPVLVSGTKLRFKLCFNLSQTLEKSQHHDNMAVLLLSSATQFLETH